MLGVDAGGAEICALDSTWSLSAGIVSKFERTICFRNNAQKKETASPQYSVDHSQEDQDSSESKLYF